MKRLPVDVSTFSIMINDNYVYVDKTEHIYNLITQGRYYFLSRPRRFGKSLLVSTLKELFLGNKKLFEELWIGKNTNYDWQEYPVIDLDFSSIPHHNAQQLSKALSDKLEEIALSYNITDAKKDSPEETLSSLIQKLSQKNKVVILIDEYDKPILDHLENIEQAKAQREVLRSFYTIIKSMDKHLKFVLLTGVTKFTKTSVFSGLNNLNDISMKPEATTLLGYTQQEIEDNFKEYIEQFAQETQKSSQNILEQMRSWYNGYRFSESLDKVYNPFSTLYCLKDKTFKNYWIKSGTPSFLIQLLKEQPQALADITELELSETSLDALDIESIQLITVLFQTGYYTILNYNPINNRYIVGYPNREVEESFTEYLMTAFSYSDVVTVDRAMSEFRVSLAKNDMARFCKGLRILFAHIPYNLHIKHESYYHSLFQLIGTMLGANIQSEVLTDKGRIDVVIISPNYVHVFEVKFNKPLSEAMQQIQERRYYEKYLGRSKHVILVGIVFNRDEKDFSIEYETKEVA